MINIVSFDGGGIRGAFSARIYDHLNQDFPWFNDEVSLYAGTSTGGLIALGLANGLSPDDLVEFYTQNCEKIFDHSFWDRVKELGGLTGAIYENKNLAKILKKVFGKITLGELQSFVLIPTFQLCGQVQGVKMWKPKFFHNIPSDGADLEDLVVDVALRTTAAPTFFPTYQGYIDGGVIANDPSMSALAQMLDPRIYTQFEPSQIKLLSIGTGINPDYIEGQRKDWGDVQWAKPIIDVMVDGSMGVSGYYVQNILGERYLKLNMMLPKKIRMDDPKAVPGLIQLADECWEKLKADVANWLAI